MTRHQSQPQQGQMGIEQLQETAMNVTYNLASVVTMPVEIWLRPRFGTEYFSPPISLLSAVMMGLASAFLSVAAGVGQMIPLIHLRGPAGLFGMADMTQLFFVAGIVHGIRIWWRMVHPELEEISTHEGPPLPIFRLLPKGNSFWFVRIVYEPLFVYLTAMALGNLFIIQGPLMLYLKVSAFFLFMKQYVAWYKAWSVLRKLMNAANAGPIIARIVENRATSEDMARVHLATLPKNIPPDIRNATVAHFAKAYSAPKEKEEM